MKSVFARYDKSAYPFVFKASLLVENICGGVPSDPEVARRWLDSKIALKDDLLRKMIAETMIERGISEEEATALVQKLRHLNGFKRDERGLYLEGRCVKACIKEAVSVCVAAGKLKALGWGRRHGYQGKGFKGYFPEHVMVPESRVYLGVQQPSGILQKFPKTRFGACIQYEEYVEQAKLSFTVEADDDLGDKTWAMIWLTAQRIGIGSSRSQGHGRFAVTQWDCIRKPKKGEQAETA